MLPGCTEPTITLVADPKVTSISIIDNKERFIDPKDQMIIAYGPSPEIPNNTDYKKIRKGIYNKLIEAQSLLPEGLKLCLL